MDVRSGHDACKENDLEELIQAVKNGVLTRQIFSKKTLLLEVSFKDRGGSPRVRSRRATLSHFRSFGPRALGLRAYAAGLSQALDEAGEKKYIASTLSRRISHGEVYRSRRTARRSATRTASCRCRTIPSSLSFPATAPAWTSGRRRRSSSTARSRRPTKERRRSPGWRSSRA